MYCHSFDEALITMYVPSVFAFYIFISASKAALVEWVPNTSFNLPINFKDGKLPCSKQTVVFENTVMASIRIESDLSVGGMILPSEGEIIMADGMIVFGDDNNCTEDGNVYYKPRSKSAWLQPDVWSSVRFNEATPDAERVPCFDDVVYFPDSEITVYLPEVTQYVRKIIVLKDSVSTWEFQRLVTYGLTQDMFVLNEDQSTGVVIGDMDCPSRAGCPCQDNLSDLDCTAKFCPVPKCVHPVKPSGHCCHICGGFLNFGISNSFDLMSFEEAVAKIVSYYGEDKVVYHIGRLPDNKVQLVVVDKGEYEGISSHLVNDVQPLTYSHGGVNLLAQISGSPLSKSGLGGKIVISMFFAVVLVMGAIYVYYYKIPEIRYPTIFRSGGLGVMSRFNRRTDSVVSLTRRDSAVTIASSSATGTAFRNPLYDSKRGRVQVAESVVEE